jgi:hypothetical protein
LTSRNPLDLTCPIGPRSTAPWLVGRRLTAPWLAALDLVARGRLVAGASPAGVAVGRNGRVLAEGTRP